MTGLAPLDRALRGVCASVDVDASEASGELPRHDAEQVFRALERMPEALACVALRTAALSGVEPQVRKDCAEEALAALGTAAFVMEWRDDGPDRASNAARCVRAASLCATRPSLEAWLALIGAYRTARSWTDATPRQLSNLWLDWAGRVVPAAAASSLSVERASLVEVLRSQRPVPPGDWYYEGGVNDSGVHVVAMTSRATRRMVHRVLSGTMRLDGRTLRWNVRALDDLPLGRVRTEELVERVLLSDLMNGHYEGRYDRIEYEDVGAKLVWSHEV